MHYFFSLVSSFVTKRFLSSELTVNIVKLLGSKNTLTLLPSFFPRVIPSRTTRVLLTSTLVIFAFFPAKEPRMISTSSPVLTRKLRVLYFSRKPFDKCAFKNLLLTCKGALCLYFLCLLGCLLAIHFVENSCFMLLNTPKFLDNLEHYAY